MDNQEDAVCILSEIHPPAGGWSMLSPVSEVIPAKEWDLLEDWLRMQYSILFKSAFQSQCSLLHCFSISLVSLQPKYLYQPFGSRSYLKNPALSMLIKFPFLFLSFSLKLFFLVFSDFSSFSPVLVYLHVPQQCYCQGLMSLCNSSLHQLMHCTCQYFH